MPSRPIRARAEVLAGIDPAVLAEIPSYVPGDAPTVPGHEVCGRIVAVGPDGSASRVGERVLVQTDYRHLPTDGANASFGYNFEGGLQEYVLMDERVIIEPDTGERFLIPVDEAPSASAVALLEPWACVERAYATEERGTPDAGRPAAGRGRCRARGRGPGRAGGGSRPGSVTALLADDAQPTALVAELGGSAGRRDRRRRSSRPPTSPDSPQAHSTTSSTSVRTPARVEELERRCWRPGASSTSCSAATCLGRPVEVDVGRIHYDLMRWVGTTGTSAADGYAMAPGSGELRDGERVGVIGAAGPMGFMHVIRALTSGRRGLSCHAPSTSTPARLAHLAHVAGAAGRGQRRGLQRRRQSGRRRWSRASPGVGVMVPSPALAAEAVRLAGDGAIVDLFAGFAMGTRAPLDLDELVRKGVYMIGTSGSVISDMKAVLAKLEAGTLDTNISVDAVAGMEGVADALAAVQARTSGGKIVIYPMLGRVGMVRLDELAERFPEVAAALEDGRWTRAAEEALLAAAGPGAPGGDAAPRAQSMRRTDMTDQRSLRYVALDFGAESGRTIVGRFDGD